MRESKKWLKASIVYVRSYNKESINQNGADEQEKVIRQYADKEGYSILKVFRDEASGKSLKRHSFEEMIDYVRANKGGVKFLLVINVSRLTCSVADYNRIKQFLRAHKIILVSITESLLREAGKQPK